MVSRALRSEEAVADEFRELIKSFAADGGRSLLEFPSSLNSFERLVVHRLAQEAGLQSGSQGFGFRVEGLWFRV